MINQITISSSSKSAQARRRILDAAYKLFLDQGYHATSMRQIAARSEMALGGIYNHYGSKDEIFSAIITEKHPFRQIVPLLALAGGDTVDDFIHNAAHAMIDTLGHHPDFLNLMLIEIVEFKGKHIPDLFESLFPQILEIGTRFNEFNGQVRPIPIPLLMRAFLGMFFSYYITQILLVGLMPSVTQEESLDTFVDIFLNGVKVADIPR
jgi:AcrR family transcriptional regulator